MNALHQPKGCTQGYKRTSSIAYKGKSKSRNRRYANTHCDILKNLEPYPGRYPGCNDLTSGISSPERGTDNPPQQERKECKDNDSTHKPELFRKHTEDEVGVRLGKEVQFAL